MPTLLCFGDSNTWGYDPDATAASPVPVRHPSASRWTGVLAAAQFLEADLVSERHRHRLGR